MTAGEALVAAVVVAWCVACGAGLLGTARSILRELAVMRGDLHATRASLRNLHVTVERVRRRLAGPEV